MKVNIEGKSFKIDSAEAQKRFNKLNALKKGISSDCVYEIIDKLNTKKKKSCELYNDIEELWDMHDYIIQIEESGCVENRKLNIIKDILDILAEERLTGGAVVLAKWAESKGYNLKGK